LLSCASATTFPFASYQPRFILEQVRAACKFQNIAMQFRPELISRALKNLYTKDTPGHGVRAKGSRTSDYAAAA